MAYRKALLCVSLAALAGTGLGLTQTPQADLFSYIPRIPQCGLGCIVDQVPKSRCRTLVNATCICTDRNFYADTQACILEACEDTMDAIETAKIEAEACGRPHRDRRWVLWPALAILIVAWIAVFIRLAERWYTFRSYQTDDWIMLVCLVVYTPFAFMGQYAGRKAFGRDVWTVDPVDLTFALKVFFVAQSFYLVCLGLTKISLLFFFLRIFPNQKFRWAVYATMLTTSLMTVVFVFLQIFQCTPIPFNWEGWKGQFGPFQCLDINRLTVACASLNIALDVIILVLPMPLLIGLEMSWRSKAGILFMFSLGLFVIATACVRLQFILLYRRSINPTWEHTDVLIWSGYEVSVSMIVTSLPAVRILLTRALPNLVSSILSRTRLSDPGSTHFATQNSKDTNSRRTLTRRDGNFPLSRRRMRFYSLDQNKDDNESEEGLQLGDRTKGVSHVKISADDTGGDGRSAERGEPLEPMPVEAGIRVQKTTRIDSLRVFPTQQ
ncbi:hypothetical protein S40285_05070 [Stachybotrys chlorohalonatus IBT 40285]|uniref:Uncharacterized protein n=1 Tax=Stachybotrys chlorohalonatus (strain IBT 40285) TaxID=1283841 RepID=A0A084Q9N9_STAC4|nr:hypothetical protein S40285_05070 [Stachybotrys chlorohalonata IBT 40285]